jgi:hypothetical protein
VSSGRRTERMVEAEAGKVRLNAGTLTNSTTSRIKIVTQKHVIYIAEILFNPFFTEWLQDPILYSFR